MMPFLSAFRRALPAIALSFSALSGSAQIIQNSPGQVSNGLVLWLDASDVNANGNQPSYGASVNTWKDKSGQGNDATIHLSQNAASFQSGEMNGKPSLRFTRIGDALGSVYQTPLDIRPVTSPDVTIFTVYKQGAGLDGNQAPWGSDNANWDRFYISSFSSSEDGVAPFGPAPPYYTAVQGGGTVGKVRLLTAIFDGQVDEGTNIGPANSSAFYFNGRIIAAFTDKTDASDEEPNFYVGWDGDNSAFGGDIAEVIVYNRRLPECEILSVNKYLADKYEEDFSATDVSLSASNAIICPGSSITLTSSEGNAYQWLKNGTVINGATDITYNATTAGDYRVAVTNMNGCHDTSATVTLTASALTATITPDGPLEFCAGGEVKLNAPPGYQYEWMADGFPLYQYGGYIYASGSGDYTVKVSDAVTGCSVTTSAQDAAKVIAYDSPDPSITPESATRFCEGGTVVLKANNGYSEYKWYRNDELIPGISGTSFTATQDGSYSLFVKTDKGCSNRAYANTELSMDVTVDPRPQAKITALGSTFFCADGQVILEAPADMQNYSWIYNGMLLNEHDRQMTATKPGKYIVQVEDYRGCKNTTAQNEALEITRSAVHRVEVSIAEPAATCIPALSIFNAKVKNGGDAPQFKWYLNQQSVPGPEASISMQTKPGDIVKVEVTSNAACVDTPNATSAPYIVRVPSELDCDNDGIVNGTECPDGINCPDCNSDGIPDYLDNKSCKVAITMPTLFTPNGDGKNDRIKPVIPGITKFHFIRIFNRWGNLVFESKNPNEGWDGTMKGKAQPADTYIWTASGINAQGNTISAKGLITLTR